MHVLVVAPKLAAPRLCGVDLPPVVLLDVLQRYDTCVEIVRSFTFAGFCSYLKICDPFSGPSGQVPRVDGGVLDLGGGWRQRARLSLRELPREKVRDATIFSLSVALYHSLAVPFFCVYLVRSPEFSPPCGMSSLCCLSTCTFECVIHSLLSSAFCFVCGLSRFE